MLPTRVISQVKMGSLTRVFGKVKCYFLSLFFLPFFISFERAALHEVLIGEPWKSQQKAATKMLFIQHNFNPKLQLGIFLREIQCSLCAHSRTQAEEPVFQSQEELRQ